MSAGAAGRNNFLSPGGVYFRRVSTTAAAAATTPTTTNPPPPDDDELANALGKALAGWRTSGWLDLTLARWIPVRKVAVPGTGAEPTAPVGAGSRPE